MEVWGSAGLYKKWTKPSIFGILIYTSPYFHIPYENAGGLKHILIVCIQLDADFLIRYEEWQPTCIYTAISRALLSGITSFNRENEARPANREIS